MTLQPTGEFLFLPGHIPPSPPRSPCPKINEKKSPCHPKESKQIRYQNHQGQTQPPSQTLPFSLSLSLIPSRGHRPFLCILSTQDTRHRLLTLNGLHSRFEKDLLLTPGECSVRVEPQSETTTDRNQNEIVVRYHRKIEGVFRSFFVLSLSFSLSTFTSTSAVPLYRRNDERMKGLWECWERQGTSGSPVVEP